MRYCRNIWVLLQTLALVLLSCTREEELSVVREDHAQDGRRVALTISIPAPEENTPTKALDEGGELNTLHLAVFGSSGYLKEYVTAIPTATDDYTYHTTDRNGNDVTHTVPCYKFTATLAVSDSPRIVHVLGNGPGVLDFGYDTAVLPTLLSSGGEKGYWQMINLPNGIRAKRDSQGRFIDADGNVIPEGGSGYVADDDTEKAFQGIPLVRNWTKIELSAAEDSHFTPISMAVVNVPTRGTMVPYSAATGFLNGYQDMGFEYLESTLKYPANLPAGTPFDSTIPSVEDFENWENSEGRVASASDGAVYLYERPAPGDQIPPSYVIIYGTYTKPDDPDSGNNYFYKVDLMETRHVSGEGVNAIYESRYYPLYRNFKYKIKVVSIAAKGHSTPAAAAASAGSADVSADINTSGLSDISDGIGRLYVTPWMSKTFTRARGETNPVTELNVFFSSNISGAPDMDPASVRAELLTPSDGGGDILYNLTLSAPSDGTDGNAEGMRPLSFCIKEPGLAPRSQTIRITGTHSVGRLYRDIVVSLQPIQPMQVKCRHPQLLPEKGLQQIVDIKIPDGLVESMFPLDFIIEAEDLTLTPDVSVSGNNLPVVSGVSISEHDGYAGKQTFQYVRTLSYSEYRSIEVVEDEQENYWRTLSCYFLTNREQSGTTVWVKNDFFDSDSDSFENYNNKTFYDLAISTSVPRRANAPVNFTFMVMPDPETGLYPEITITPTGMLKNMDTLLPGPEDGTYVYTPTSQNITLSFLTTTDDGDVSLSLWADGFLPASVKPYWFNRYGDIPSVESYGPLEGMSGGTFSNVAFGKINMGYNTNSPTQVTTLAEKQVYFGYYDDPSCLNPEVTLYDTTYKPLSDASNVSGLKEGSTTLPFKPTGPLNNNAVKTYHQIALNTNKNLKDQPVFFILSAAGYVEEHFTADRFCGRIHTIKNVNAAGLSGNSYNLSTHTFTYYDSSDFGYCELVIEPIGEAPEVIKDDPKLKGLVLGKNSDGTLASGSKYRIIAKTGDLSGNTGIWKNQMLLYLYFTIDPKNRPASVQTNDEKSVWYLYPGNNNAFIWKFLQEGVTESELEITVGDTNPVLLAGLTFKSWSAVSN